MAKRPVKTLIVVADGSRARFFRPEAGRLVSAGPSDLVAPQSRQRPRTLASDSPGRSFSSARSGARHALEPHQDHHKLEKHRFMTVVAAALDAAHANREFDELVLVAPRRSLGELRGLLPAAVRGRIREEVAKDLTNEPVSRLQQRLDAILGPLVAAPARMRAL